MLFRHAQVAAIREGRVTVSFRVWRAPQAKAGGVYRLGDDGRIEVTSVQALEPGAVAADDLARAGYSSEAELFSRAAATGATVYRVDFRYLPGAKPTAVRELPPSELAKRLQRLDERAAAPWTAETLGLISARPHTAARLLAASAGRETFEFKTDVRKLKALGLTRSHEVGYSLTPAGEAMLAAAQRNA